jgi:ribose transport system ATP-binding protein
VLYVSHRMDEIFRICDRVTVMRDGRVVGTHAIAETSPADLIRLMTGRQLQQVYPARTTPHADTPLLEVHGLRTALLDNISFDLKAGEIIGLAGLSGAGRTEILRALMGADRILGGSIYLHELHEQFERQRLRRLRSPAAAWRFGFGFVPEERRSQGLVLVRSISNNVSLPHLRSLSIGGAVLHHAREHTTAAAFGERVQLRAQSVRQPTYELSGGNQQKTVFARALAGNPRVLLLDEPTRGVDVGAKYDIYALIREISAAGTGIIMVSSDLPELIGLCDRILVLRRGSIAATLDPRGLTEEALLSACYGEMSGKISGNVPHGN